MAQDKCLSRVGIEKPRSGKKLDRAFFIGFRSIMMDTIPRIDNLPPDDPVALQGRRVMKLLQHLFDKFNTIPLDALKELSQFSSKLMLSGVTPVALGDFSFVCVVATEGNMLLGVPLDFGKKSYLLVLMEAIRLLSYAKDLYNDKMDDGLVPRARAYMAEFAKESLANNWTWGDAVGCLTVLEGYPRGLGSLDEKYKYESKPLKERKSSFFDMFPKCDPSLN
ncbi:MAG: hypothetical protein M0R80_01435 [Proteobacteria bacterium]|nr:hypothetical protein [Pseudomonadota bacterium]